MYAEYNRLLTFDSVHQAIKAEQLLIQTGCDVMVIPTPREIDVSCGQCLLFSSADESRIRKAIEKGQVRWSKLFRRDGNNRVYELLADYEG
ncbi:Hypothetical protein LUCI_2767 [Lucifera butyrica]|uniref:Putative Se/S carrier protein-like domain-containing protein n=1 Tax=Lucifera butyrica TaxID=1351585 RepID=A0A498REA3_9FIRM|nr:Hypothetical protein LUCI_2767 [Lucifera butyrica]